MSKDLGQLRQEYSENEAKLQQYQHRAEGIDRKRESFICKSTFSCAGKPSDGKTVAGFSNDGCDGIPSQKTCSSSDRM